MKVLSTPPQEQQQQPPSPPSPVSGTISTDLGRRRRCRRQICSLPAAGPYLPCPPMPQVSIDVKGLPRSTSTGAHLQIMPSDPWETFLGRQLYSHPVLATASGRPPCRTGAIAVASRRGPTPADCPDGTSLSRIAGNGRFRKRRGGNTQLEGATPGYPFETAAPWQPQPWRGQARGHVGEALAW